MKHNEWTQVPQGKLNEKYQKTHKIFSSNKWFSSDNDSVMLTIDFEFKIFELQCFSGITGSSTIIIDDIDRGVFGLLISDHNDYEQCCFEIAEFFCELFCQDLETAKKMNGKTGIDTLIEISEKKINP